MSKSKCCKATLFVEGSGEGTYYYVCTKCKHPSDPMVHFEYDPETEMANEVPLATF